MKKAIHLITFNKYGAHTEPLYMSLNVLNLGKYMWDVNHKGLTQCLMKILNFYNESKPSQNITHSNKYIPVCRTI